MLQRAHTDAGSLVDRSAARFEGRRAGLGPRRPPPDRATDDRVRELLAAAGYNREITPEVLERHRVFTTHAGIPGLSRWKSAVTVLNGAMGAEGVPRFEDIYAEDSRRRSQRQRRSAYRRRHAGSLADEHESAARAYVARVRVETGQGPTRRELARALGLPAPLASAVVHLWLQREALTASTEPRSLDVPPMGSAD